MKIKLLLPLVALILSACDNPPIKPEPAKTDPPDAKFNNLELDSLSKEVRAKLGATDKDDMVVVVKAKDKGGVIVYGAPGGVFKKAAKGDLERYIEDAKKAGKDVKIVNEIRLITLRASPECQWYDDGAGNVFWYLDNCPN